MFLHAYLRIYLTTFDTKGTTGHSPWRVMASYYLRGRVYWIKYRDKFGTVCREPTTFRAGPAGKRGVDALCAARTADEKQVRGVSPHERWDAWVTDFLTKRYGDRLNTFSAYTGAWAMVRMFLREKQIVLPRQLTRDHCLELLDWRQKQGRRGVCHNSALYGLRMLGLVMNEAVARGYAASNPCRYLGIKRKATKEKPAYDAGHITMIRRHIQAMPEGPVKEFFNNSFEIARHHGCRISATQLNPQTQVDLQRDIICFREKGNKLHVAPLHPAVRPLFERLIAEGRTTTYEPVGRTTPSKRWGDFLQLIGIKAIAPNACFHSWRVTVSTELAVHNVSMAKAMRYVGHASTTVHRIYQRLNVEHVREVVDAISDKRSS